ncbi:MAG: hypothetical protein JO370_14140 [Paucibacter sp.]|nr:hypothetical protein [Roseateles sp.]
MLYEFVHPNKRLEDVSFYSALPDANIHLHDQHLQSFFNFMAERQNVWYKRNILKQKAPWTSDKLLANYAFTNVYRELDRSSQWLIRNVISDKSLELKDLIFRIFIYRYFNKPDAFEDGYVDLPTWDNFDPVKLHKQVINCRKHYNPWHTAYMSNLVWAKKQPFEGEMFKDHAYCIQLFPQFRTVSWFISELLTSGNKPVIIMKNLNMLPSISGFMSHELWLDYCLLQKYNKYDFGWDENSYTNVGPGASLGIRLIFPSLSPQGQEEGIYALRDVSEHMLSDMDFKYVKWDGKEYVDCEHNITLHQIEFVLCEYSKYWKMQIGIGKQRSKFVPH